LTFIVFPDRSLNVSISEQLPCRLSLACLQGLLERGVIDLEPDGPLLGLELQRLCVLLFELHDNFILLLLDDDFIGLALRRGKVHCLLVLHMGV
jgi:hypothetical protein